MRLEERERRLLDLIAEYRDAECRALLDKARAEARAQIATAYRQARSRLHEHVLMERANARARLHAARAERDTRSRASGERANARLLELAWPLLRQSLLARWADRVTRQIWAEQALALARRTLPSGLWTVHHPPDWVAQEWTPLAMRLTRELATAPRFQADAALSAGLLVVTEGAMLDASLEGLLKDRRRVEARLLSILAQLRGQDDA
jgi:hypothetical protein